MGVPPEDEEVGEGGGDVGPVGAERPPHGALQAPAGRLRWLPRQRLRLQVLQRCARLRPGRSHLAQGTPFNDSLHHFLTPFLTHRYTQTRLRFRYILTNMLFRNQIDVFLSRLIQ